MPVTISPSGRSFALVSNSFTNAAASTIISPSDGNAAHTDLNDAINTALTFAQIDGQRRVMGVQAYTATPPGSPIDGQAWLVGTGATGAWSGKDKQYAVYRTSGWLFFSPGAGDMAIIVSTRQMFVYDSGNVWQPGPAPGRLASFAAMSLTANLTTPTSGTSAAFDITTWSAPVYNYGSGFVAGTGRFTAPVAGIYQVNAGISLPAFNGGATTISVILLLNINGSAYTQVGTSSKSSGFNDGLTLSVPIQMAAGDYINARISHVAGGSTNFTIGAAGTFVAATLVG